MTCGVNLKHKKHDSAMQAGTCNVGQNTIVCNDNTLCKICQKLSDNLIK